MEVILQEDYPSLGYVGDRVEVKGGFARNFLIPRGIAVEAHSRNARILNHKLGAILAKKARRRGEAQILAKHIDGLKFEFVLKIGEQGKSYGSVTARDIEMKLKESGYDLDRRQVRLIEPLRTAGEHKVPVKLHAEVQAALTVTIVSDRPAKPPVPSEGEVGEKTGDKRRSSKRTVEVEVEEDEDE